MYFEIFFNECIWKMIKNKTLDVKGYFKNIKNKLKNILGS